MIKAVTPSESIALQCVWPDFQPIRTDMDIHPLIGSTLDAMKTRLKQFGIKRVMLINDVIYPFNNLARDVLKFESTDVRRLSVQEKMELFALVMEMAECLTVDANTPSQPVMWNDDMYILMSTCAAVMKTSRAAS